MTGRLRQLSEPRLREKSQTPVKKGYSCPMGEKMQCCVQKMRMERQKLKNISYSGPKVINEFFMLNSAEHENSNQNKAKSMQFFRDFYGFHYS